MSRLCFLVVVGVLCVAFTPSVAKPKEEEEVPTVVPEEECLAAGGHCVHQSKCPEGLSNQEVDCPKQKAVGVVCCHSAIPPGETQCEKLHGECKANCTDTLTVSQAEDCPIGQVCCTLV